MKRKSDKKQLGLDLDRIVLYDKADKKNRPFFETFDILIRAIAVFMAVLGLLLCLEGVFEFELELSFLTKVLAALSFLYSIILSFDGKAKTASYIAAIVLTGIFFIVFYKDIFESYKLTYNTISGFYASYYSKNVFTFTIDKSVYPTCDYAVIITLGLTCLLYSISASKCKDNVLSFFVILPYIVLMLACGKMPDIIPGIMAASGYFLITVIHNGVYNIRDDDSVFNNNLSGGNVFASAVASLVIAACAVAGSLKVYPAIENRLSPIRQLVYESDLSEIVKKIRESYVSGGINDGELGRGTEIRYNHKTHLSVSSDKDIDYYTYLKGYTADIYTGDSWKTISHDVSKDGISDDLYEIMSLPYSMTSSFDDRKISAQLYFNIFKPVRLKVTVPDKSVGDSNFVCFPYNSLLSEDDGRLIDINYVKREKGEELTNYFDCYIPNSGGYTPSFINAIRYNYQAALNRDTLDYESTDIENDVRTYGQLEEKYREFVYENDLQLPEGFEDFKQKYGGMDFDYNKAILFVQSEVARGSEYTLKPDRIPRGKDFIHYFMDESKKGYCVYFASAAVMIFRSLGIPARYVQGYLIPPMKADVQKDIDDSYAHAWVEIYIDSFGWVPVEVTPGSNSEPGGFTPGMNSGENTSHRDETLPDTTSEEMTSEESSEEDQTETSSVYEVTETETDTAKTEVAEASSEENESHSVRTSEGPYKDDRKNHASDNKHTQTSVASDSKGYAVSKRAIELIKIISGCVLTVIVVWCLLYMRRRRLCSSRRRRFKQSSQKNSFLAIYRELCAMTKRYYVVVDEDLGSVKKLSKAYGVEEDVWNQIFDTAIEAAYSLHDISSEKTSLMLSVYHKCKNVIYDNISIPKKVLFILWDAYR